MFQIKKLKTRYLIFLGFIFTINLYPQAPDSNFQRLLEQSNSFIGVNRDSVNYYGEKAIAYAENMQNKSYLVKAYLNLTISEILSGELISAYEKTEQANEIIEKYNLIDQRPEVLIYRGVVYKALGQPLEALKFFFNAQDELEKNAQDDDFKRKSDLYFYIGQTYADLKEEEMSIEYLDQSIIMALKSSNPAIAFKCYILLADSYSDTDSIQKYYRLAEEIVNNNQQLQYEKAIFLTNQALIEESIGNKKKSKSYYLQSIQLAKEKGFQKLLSITYNNYAYLLMDEGNLDSALIALQIALEKSIITNQVSMEAEVYDSFSDYFTEIGDFKKALEYKNLNIKTNEKFTDNQRIQESLFLAAVFETKKKEEEILASENKLNQFRSILFGSLALIAILLTVIIYFSQKSALTVAKLESVEKGKSLEIANALLEGTDNERKRLAMDLHDGLGAQLGSLKFMVDTYIEDNPNYQKITNSIDDICQNVRGLSHRMLPTQLEKLGLVPTIQNLAHSINQSSGFNVDIELEVEERLEPKLEINLYYLIFELINNAIKHSKGDSLFIQLLSHEDGLNLSVEDNGEGFNVNESKDGLGMKNIKHRVEYLGGKLIIDSKIGQGTLFMIELPS
ncbi:MAG TPA: sensor histidine kinase [Bacteroidales bacterium]